MLKNRNKNNKINAMKI